MSFAPLAYLVWQLVGARAAGQVPQQPCFISTVDPVEADIVRAVCAGNQARMDYWVAKGNEEAAREAVRGAPIGSDERFARLREWMVAYRANEGAKNRISANFQRALALAVNHYGITPSLGNGPLTGGPAADPARDVPWTPRYRGRLDRSKDFVEEIVLPGDKAMHVRVRGELNEKLRPGGMTWPNGRTDIYDETFDKVLQTGSPRQLGFILHHESVHFDQLRGNRWASENVREVDAYRESRKSMGRFGLTKDERDDVELLFRENLSKVQRQTIRPWTRPRNVPAPEDEARDAQVWANAAQQAEGIRNAQSELEQELKREAEDRRLREAVAERGRADQLAREARDEARRQANERARATLTVWLENECKNGSLPDSLTAEQVRRAYDDLVVEGAVFNLWDLPYYSGIPCPALLSNLLMRNRQAGRPFRAWDDWFSLAVLANERSHSSPPAPDSPQGPSAAPQPWDDGDVGRGNRDNLPPRIPHCRYHPWCQE